MNDFPELTPPPERDLTPEQRARIRASLPLDHPDEQGRSWWITGAAAAAAVLVVVGGAIALSVSIGGDGSTHRQVGPADGGTPALPKPSVLCPSDGCGPHLVQVSEPMSFGAHGTECFGGAPRTLTMFEQVTPVRDIVLTTVAMENPSGAVIDRAWIAPKPVGAVASGGTFQDPIPKLDRRDTGWDDRRALAGARLQAGTTYTLFVRVTVAERGHFDALDFAYDESDGAAGTVVWQEKVRARTSC